MGDDARDSLVSAKVFNQSFRGFSCKTSTFKLRQNGVTNLDFVWGYFCEGTESAYQSARIIRMPKYYVAIPADLFGMVLELCE